MTKNPVLNALQRHAPPRMKITSPAFAPDDSIPAQFTCDGEDKSPPLQLHDVPSPAQSLVLIMEDPDVPKRMRADGMWDHWIVFNIPPATTEILEGTEPPGVHGTGTDGTMHYHGPCPPDREHRYFFKLYALDTMLALAAGASKNEVEEAMRGHILAEAALVSRYRRVGQ